MFDPFPARFATLTTGETAPLVPAARALARLQDLLDCPDAEWDLAYHLRELCLGRPVDPQPLRTLTQERLVGPDGEVDPTLRAVVLAAVRGCGRVLHLEPPFVDRVDQRIAEFVAAREYLEVELASDEFANLLAGDDALGRAGRALAEPPVPPDLQDDATFARRIRRKAERDRADHPPAEGGPTP